MNNKEDWVYKKFFCSASIDCLGKLMQSMMSHEVKIHSLKRISTYRSGFIVMIHKSRISSFEEENNIQFSKLGWDEILRAEILDLTIV